MTVKDRLKQRVLRWIKEQPPDRRNRLLVIPSILRRLGAVAMANRVDPAVRAMGHVVKVRPPARLKEVSGFRMYTHGGRDQIARDIWIGGWESFEWPVPDMFAAWACRCRGRILDIGANTGFYTLLAVRSSPEAVVDAFEPFEPVEALLRANLELNLAHERVRVFRKAVSDQPGSAQLNVPFADHGLVETSCSLDPESRDRFASTVSVPVTTVDEHVARLPARVELIKSDVEALDHKVLLGAQRVMEEHRPVVFFELLPQGNPSAIEDLRAGLGYVAASMNCTGVHLTEKIEADASTWNRALVPEEAAATFFELAARCLDGSEARRLAA